MHNDQWPMQPFSSHCGRVVALRRANVDTDQIIPKQFLKRIERSGFGIFLFHDWRYRVDGTLDPEFELNQPEAQGATILLAGANFGCGSSREHAPWALQDYGFKAIIAPSFADIFSANCCQNGLLPIALPASVVDDLFQRCVQHMEYQLIIDLQEQVVRDAHGFHTCFSIDDYRRQMLLRGLDQIGRTLLEEPLIAAFERRRATQASP
jgi:3-isopropylmalate/(R)-2-methylmalate dehydratase small subunit